MTEDPLEKMYIPHLATQFRQATPVLFTGAGFAQSAKNIRGDYVPGSEQLCREIWTICFPSEEYEQESSLRDLFEDARLNHAGKLKQRLTELLSIDARELPEIYGTIFSMPWSRCYTLNIDDIENVVSTKFDLPRRLRSLSATSSLRPRDEQQENRVLDVIHLNGTLADLPNDVTFSTLQYAERLTQADPWYTSLIGDLLSRTQR